MDHTTIPLKDTFRFIHEPLRGRSARQRPIGRHHELHDLASRILLSQGGAFLVTGYRGVGKTTYINQVIEEVQRQKDAMTDYTGKLEVVDVALNIARPMKPVNLMFHILRGLYNRLEEKNLLKQLQPDVLQELELAFTRTSMSVELNANQQTEESASVSQLSSMIPFLNVTPQLGFSTKRTKGSSKALTYLAYDDSAAEFDLIRLARKLCCGNAIAISSWRRLLARLGWVDTPGTRLKVVFIFDELDKLEDESKEGEVTALHEILSSLKNLFTTSGVVFLFVAGKGLHDHWLEDIGKGDSIYESIFAHAMYLPVLWDEVDEFCDPLVGIVNDAGAKTQRRQKAYESFKKLLAYKGRGIPRRIIRTFNEYVKWRDGQLWLQFTPDDIRRFTFYSHLYDTLLAEDIRFMGSMRDHTLYEQQDQRRLALYYLTDWILKQGLRAFTLQDATAALQRLSKFIAPKQAAVQELVDVLVNALLGAEYLQTIKLENLTVPDQGAALRYQLLPRRLIEMGYTNALLQKEEQNRVQEASRGIDDSRYELKEVIARGGMATVYKAYDKQLEKHVAIKQLPESVGEADSGFERFMREADAMSKLSHPGFVSVYDVGKGKHPPYIAMEFIDGVPLSELIRRQSLRQEDVLNITRQLLSALQYLHNQGVVWGDLKPSNIMVTKQGQVRIIDMGAAKSLQGEETVRVMKRQIVGTPRYMSPEHIGGNKTDGRSDIFALGVLLYELTTGKAPFGDDPMQMLMNNEWQTIPPGEVSSEALPFEKFILKCLRKNPDERYQSAEQAAVDLPNLVDSDNLDNLVEHTMTISSEPQKWDLGAQTQLFAFDALTPIIPEDWHAEPQAPVTPSPPAASGIPRMDAATRGERAAEIVFDVKGKVDAKPLAVLHITERDNRQYTVPLMKESITIGRNEGNDIQLMDREISRYHARLSFASKDHCYIEDLNSVNGILLNGKLVSERAELHDKDEITLGATKLKLELQAAPTVSTPLKTSKMKQGKRAKVAG